MLKSTLRIQPLLIILMCIVTSATWANETDPFITQFNDDKVGIAFSMLSQKGWQNPAQQHFHSTPTTPQKTVQAVTISNSSKDIWPYPADSRYGLAFSIDEESDFYQYFATKSAFKTSCDYGTAKFISPITNAPGYSSDNPIASWALSCNEEQIAFCGRCSDGGICAGTGNTPITDDGLWPALGQQVPYSQFQIVKNAIVNKTGPSCNWIKTDNAWNEFDTNGFSPKALQGVLIDGITPGTDRNWAPSETVLCNYFKSVDSTKTSWPKYTLQAAPEGTKGSQLKKTGMVECSQ